jgi:DNA polymerase-1
LGREALKVLIGHRASGRANFTPFSKWVGWEIPDQDLGVYINPLDSPLHVLKSYDHPVIERKFLQGLEKAVKIKPFYKTDYASETTVILEEDKAIECLEDLRTRDYLAFDYETTGLKPQREGHRLLCVSFSDGFHSWAFPIFDTVKFHKALMKVLRNKRVGKIAHNATYEQYWTKQMLNYEVNNLCFDTALAAHVLDNRKGIVGLKFQTYVNYGVIGYDSSVDKYMSAVPEGEDKKSSNRFNLLSDMDMAELCSYCALDSLFTYKLFEMQTFQLDSMGVRSGYELLHNSNMALTDVSFNGIKVNEGRLQANVDLLDNKIEELHNEIINDVRMELWDGEEEFNYNSSQQLAHMLFDILGYTPKNLTASGQPATDKEALEAIPERFVQKILERKKLDKLKTTYLIGTKREIVDGKIHPGFNMLGVSSFRTSSQNPNYQNLPAHDDFARDMILSPIEPDNDFIVAVDEKSLEVMIGACYHLDEKMLEFLELGDKADMHRVVSSKVFMVEESQVTGSMRRVGKTINFASQYGSSAYNIAMTSWEKLFDKDMRQHMRNKGIKNFNMYLRHIENVMKWYWEELFSAYGQWREDNWNSYLENGYTELKIGLKCTDIMRYTQANNFLIQGAAAQLVLFSLTKIQDYIKANKLRSKIILYIHDSIEFDVKKEEWDYLKPVIHYWMTKGIKDNFPWVVAPLGIEMGILL